MPVDSGQTALLIFSRTASSEAAVKTFDRQAGQAVNRTIARRLIRQTLATAHRSRLPVFIHYDDRQSAGETFGERLAQAFESVFAKGYTKVIALGNDCADVSASLLLDASRRLGEEKLVLGPAHDGGVYLIGLPKAAYRRQAFVDLPWETAQLQAGWENYLADTPLAIDWLEPFGDIDQASDFKALLARLPQWNRLRKQLLCILASFFPALTWAGQPVHSVAQLRLTPLRGPPAV